MTEIRSRELVPLPLASWEAVVSAFEPGRVATRARYRNLRAQGFISAGVTCASRTATGRLAGSERIHSMLALWSARLAAAGQPAAAHSLVAGASRLEEVFGAAVAAWQAKHELSEIEAAPFYEELSDETVQGLSDAPTVASLITASAVLDSVDANVAHFVGVRPDGAATTVDLPSYLLPPPAVDISWIDQPFFVIGYHHGSSVQVVLEPAAFRPRRHEWVTPTSAGRPVLPWDSRLDHVLRVGRQVASAAELRSPTVTRRLAEDDGLTDDERQEQGRLRDEAVGRLLGDPELAEALRAAIKAGTLPRRTVRPAG